MKDSRKRYKWVSGRLWRCLCLWLVVFLPGLPSTLGEIAIRTPPSNVTAVLGDDAIFNCDVSEMTAIDSVFWKKVTENNSIEVLTYNTRRFNETKYSVLGFYTLVIHDVQMYDEGWYECQAGTDRRRATLFVAVLAENVTLKWDTPIPLSPPADVHMCCLVKNSRPPAEIRWFRGPDDISEQAQYTKHVLKTNGFGDSSSVLTVAADTRFESQPYTCIAVIPGTNYTRSVSSVPIIDTSISGSAQVSVSLCLLLCTYIYLCY